MKLDGLPEGKTVVHMSWYCDMCVALTHDGLVFVYGDYFYGQFGNGTTEDNYPSFTLIDIDERAKDVSCSLHTLILTYSNKLYGFGNNDCFRLFKKKERFSMFIDTVDAAKVNTLLLENPAKMFFLNPKSYNVEQREYYLSKDRGCFRKLMPEQKFLKRKPKRRISYCGKQLMLIIK